MKKQIPTIERMEKEFDRLLLSFNKDLKEAYLMFCEEGWEYKLRSFFCSYFEEVLEYLRFKKISDDDYVHEGFYNQAVSELNTKIKNLTRKK